MSDTTINTVEETDKTKPPLLWSYSKACDELDLWWATSGPRHQFGRRLLQHLQARHARRVPALRRKAPSPLPRGI